MGNPDQTNELGARLLANARLALAHARGEEIVPRPRERLVIAIDPDADLPDDARAAIATALRDGTAIRLLARTPAGLANLSPDRAAAIIAQVQVPAAAGAAEGEHHA